MNQKGFANIILIVFVVVLAGALGYVALVKKPVSTPTNQSQSNVQLPQPTPITTNDNIQTPTPPTATETPNGKFIFPSNADTLKVGQAYVIRWESPQKYLGQSITQVRLDPVGYPGSAWGLVSQRAGLKNEGKATVVIPEFLSDIPGFTFPGTYTITVATISGQEGVEGFGLTSNQFRIIK